MPFDLADIFDNLSGLIPVLIIIGGAALSYLSKQDQNKKKQNSANKPKPAVSNKPAGRTTQNTKTAAKRTVVSGTFGQERKPVKAQKSKAKQETAVHLTAEKEAERLRQKMERESSVTERTAAKHASNVASQAVHGRMSLKQAMIAKEILDKPVSMRKP
ncbi:hypothetical protein MFLO_12831 [Listeria floridensis FSL S10-1187]|uniref:Uncharacterized protein n=1 Tax=Listeria floridensis FSL S10-1187 TaxID=1265817 RepID=A0ABP3AVL6_9LIST|nr:hypothetical protein [Listeria floridensis]EUJ28045.1 hypothetical protein MFLO_12831 [Listeria floridensis FSL S10-1187]